jgi:hypothetical protein
MKFIRMPTFAKLLQADLVLYAAMVALLMLPIGCSQGPISDEEAEELRAEVKEMREQLTKTQNDLADVIKKAEESEIEELVVDVRNKLDSMIDSLSDVEDKLKPKEPPKPPAGQAPPPPPPGGAGGGAY